MTADEVVGAGRLAVSDDVVVRELDAETVVLHLKSGMYSHLNEVAAMVLRLIGEGASRAETFDKILAEYDVEADVLHADLARVITELTESGILVAD